MQAELQVWCVIAGREHCMNTQGVLRLTSKIGTEEKAGDWLSIVCPISVAIRLATRPHQPGDSDFPDIPAIGSCNMHPA
jgi:hypothetical protein